MRKLLDFLVKERHWFLFVLLEIVSFVLVCRNNDYQRNVLFGSANIVTGHIASFTGYISSYFNLRDINKQLLDRNAQLELDLLRLTEQIETIKSDTITFAAFASDSAEVFPYSHIMARVVNNSTSYFFNYITVDKGSKDGVRPDMGVVSNKGVVGIVSTVSEHFSVVIPLLNPKYRLSCKVFRSRHFGSLGWNGRNSRYANLDELPRHVSFQKGDTIVTSGYSSVFPSGLIVGTISSFEKQHDDNFYSVEVLLSTDFDVLTNVYIIDNFLQAEQVQLEREAMKND